MDVLAVATVVNDEDLRQRQHHEDDEQQQQQHRWDVASLEHLPSPAAAAEADVKDDLMPKHQPVTDYYVT